ncbi:hypothetical protein Tco_1383173 [Tanacetum coccineum]
MISLKSFKIIIINNTSTLCSTRAYNLEAIYKKPKVLADAAKTNVHTYTRRRRAVNTCSGGISTAEESVSIASASMPVSTADMV